MEYDRLLLTHEFLSQMLGASRTTVILATGLLQRAGLIDYKRGVVTVACATKLFRRLLDQSLALQVIRVELKTERN